MDRRHGWTLNVSAFEFRRFVIVPRYKPVPDFDKPQQRELLSTIVIVPQLPKNSNLCRMMEHSRLFEPKRFYDNH
jgi:hypothetical protein